MASDASDALAGHVSLPPTLLFYFFYFFCSVNTSSYRDANFYAKLFDFGEFSDIFYKGSLFVSMQVRECVYLRL
jgi:hypothetical protein